MGSYHTAKKRKMETILPDAVKNTEVVDDNVSMVSEDTAPKKAKMEV